jgi:hypothetical protein
MKIKNDGTVSLHQQAGGSSNRSHNRRLARLLSRGRVTIMGGVPTRRLGRIGDYDDGG